MLPLRVSLLILSRLRTYKQPSVVSERKGWSRMEGGGLKVEGGRWKRLVFSLELFMRLFLKYEIHGQDKEKQAYHMIPAQGLGLKYQNGDYYKNCQ